MSYCLAQAYYMVNLAFLYRLGSKLAWMYENALIVGYELWGRGKGVAEGRINKKESEKS
jgi:hypothetical protein